MKVMTQVQEPVKEDEDQRSPSENLSKENIVEDTWLIRDCELYKDEYNECTSFRSRFHQYFIFGESVDCNQWKRDYDNCCRWTENKDVRAAEAVISSEKARRLERLRAHYRNDVWNKREAPPTDWDKPLPEWMLKRNENTYLAQKAQEIREGKVDQDKGGLCSIM